MAFIVPLAIAAGTALASHLGKPKEDKEAKKLMERAMREFEQIKTPSIADMQYQLTELVNQGVLTPEQAKAMLVESSAYDDVSVDPSYRGAQEQALRKFLDISEAGGLDAQARARLAEVENRELSTERGQREAILQNMAQRGIGGSGFELAANLQAQQEGASRRSMQDVNVAAEAERRALEALTQGASLGGQMQGQAFGEQSQIAAAKDAMAKFNAANRQQTELTNVGARNEAAARNLGEQQRISDVNIMGRNDQAKYNAGLAQQQYENKLKRAAGMSGQLQAMAQQSAEQNKRAQDYQTGVIGTGAQLMADYYSGGTAGAAKKKPRSPYEYAV